MKKKSVYVWLAAAALMMSACSDNNENIQPGETASLEFNIAFEGTATVRAAAETKAIPVTSWDKSIKEVQFFLYDASGMVKYSAIAKPGDSNDTPKKYVYTDVPVGTYTLVAVANANSTSNSITSYIDTELTEWNAFNVRNKNINKLLLKYKTGSFPSYANPAGNTAYAVPAEIFMGYATGIEVKSGQKVTAPLVKLTREVSLMRVRLNVEDTDAGVNNSTNVDGGVDWSQDVSVLIYTLPDNMKIEMGNTGGVANASTKTNVLVGATSFNMANPAAADYSNPTTMIPADSKFKRWNDIVVFPNNGGRANNGALADTHASIDQKYYIVVSARGKKNHKLADGKLLTTDQTIYWDGLIHPVFFPNKIREVNLTLKSGGKPTIPVTPVEQGELTVEVGTPEPWDGNILATEIIL